MATSPSMSDTALQHLSLGIAITGVSVQDDMVYGYRGLPYGRLEKRWTRAFPYVHTPGSRFDASHFGPKCPQDPELNCTKDYGPFIAFPDVVEDDLTCLNLNIYAPSVRLAGSLPVFVWIHGGSLSVGAGSDPIWDPAVLVKESSRIGKAIVAVTINYRLGPFGFLAPKDPHDCTSELGNFGFHDQYLALQWIQKHIAGFGGDPSRVTLGGESAGGCSVHAQIALQANEPERLFSRAILQSGNLAVMGFCDRVGMDALWQSALTLAGCDLAGDSLETMRRLPAKEIMANTALSLPGYKVFLDDVFVTQPLIAADGQFLTHAHDLDAVLHGDNAHEGNFFRDTARKASALDQLRDAAVATFGAAGCADLLNLYGLSSDLAPDELAYRLHQFPEDVRFYLPSDELQRAWPDAAFYHLTAQSPFSSSAWPGDSFHTLDMLYIFGNFDHFLALENKTEHLRVGLEMRSIWLGFIGGQESWKGSTEGQAMTFAIGGMRPQSFDQCREWPNERLQRLRALNRLGVSRVIQVCTLLYP